MTASRKFALVIGNNNYAGRARLQNAENDARGIRAKLEEVGFEVRTIIDGSAEAIRSEIDITKKILESRPAGTGLFYYSGHGMQVRDENFIVPVDIDTDGEASAKLIRVKEITDAIASQTDTSLIFLDACRDNPFSKTVSQSNERTRSWDIPKSEFDVSGLARLDSPSDTLIAFAAAPGETATDHGELGHSPFTQALLDNIASVDLPLTNLLQRVSEEVANYTKGAQQPWYHSSLSSTFFFNPGALITLTGNMLALLAIASALVIFATTIVDGFQPLLSVGGTLTVLVAIAILVFGMHRAYRRLRGSREPDEMEPRNFVRRLVLKGGLGGLVGAIIVVPLIAIPYFNLYRQEEWQDRFPDPVEAEKRISTWCLENDYCHSITLPGLELVGRISLEMVVAGASVSALLGILCWFAASVYWSKGQLHAVSHPTAAHLFAGSIAGGILTGLIMGPPVTAYFAYQIRPIVDPQFLVPFAVAASAIVAFSLVNYSLEKMSWKQLRRSAVGALGGLVGGVLVGVAVFFPLYQFGVVDAVIDWMADAHRDHDYKIHRETTLVFLGGGGIYGLFLGIVLGSVFAFTRYWTPGEVARGRQVREAILWPRRPPNS